MKKGVWLFVIATLFIQEPATTDAALFQVRHLHLNIWLVNVFWFVATVIDIMVGYYAGKLIQYAARNTSFERWSWKWAEKAENFIGVQGEKTALILFGIINFPYVSSFVGSWLRIRFRTLFICLLLGDAIYWAIEWGINLGVRGLFDNPHTALFVVVGVAFVFSLFSKAILSKVLKDKKPVSL